MTGSATSDPLHPPLASVGSPDWPAIDIGPRIISWRNWVGPLISFAVLVAAVSQLRSLRLAQVIELVPMSPGFWITFVASYLALPVSDWAIYRRLWQLPLSGLIPLIRKRISNEILLGYSGEVYFYAWARKHVAIAGAPFGVIKDVAILSAQVGNAATLLLVALAWPLLGPLHLGAHSRDLILSSVAIVLMSMPVLLFRRNLLSLPARSLWMIAGVHAARVAAGLLLTAAVWHFALPDIGWSWWVLLAALRQLLSRLPFMPNKDVAFAGLAAYLLGSTTEIAAMIAMIASVTLLFHVVLGAVLGSLDLAKAPEAA